MITSTSRYNNVTLVAVDDAVRGEIQSMVPPGPISRLIQFSYYRVTSSDTIDWLADKFLGDGKLWWVIANANPEILDWTTLPVGEVLRIPNA